MVKIKQKGKKYFKLDNNTFGIACKEYFDFITNNFPNQEFQSNDIPKVNRSFFKEAVKTITYSVSTSALENICKVVILNRMCEIGLLGVTNKINFDEDPIFYSLTRKGKKVELVFETE